MQQHQQLPQHERLAREHAAREQTKSFQCIYPLYFDSTRSRAEGRRVAKGDSVANPLAREIVDALQWVGNSRGVPLKIVFEPDKGHPRDWANPGRVRVLIKEEGRAVWRYARAEGNAEAAGCAEGVQDWEDFAAAFSGVVGGWGVG
ncbi:signal recognition particle subunit [Friedmanniomyces endolithicus]|nr:signal recognition particle subunit [Friedmanniomyces endolithicus]